MQDWMELESRVHLHTFKRVPVVLVRGEGCRVWDVDGREYLDLVGGWAVDSLGHCAPIVVDALHEQAQRLIQVSNQFYTIPQLELARLLTEHSPCDRVFFANSGAEANEGAVKLARRWGKRERGGAYAVISTMGSGLTFIHFRPARRAPRSSPRPRDSAAPPRRSSRPAAPSTAPAPAAGRAPSRARPRPGRRP